MRKEFSNEELFMLNEASWFISDGCKREELAECAGEILRQSSTVRELLKLNKIETANIGIDFVARKATAIVLESVASEQGYSFSIKEYEKCFEVMEDYEVIKLKEWVIDRIEGSNWVDKSILNELKRVNDQKIAEHEMEFDKIMGTVKEVINYK